jgi:outer membrane autotransporter protein
MKQNQQYGVWMAAAWITLPATVFAANPDFQTAVTAAENGICINFGASPVCGASDLSGASESSLAPTQALAHSEGELAQAREQAKRAMSEDGGGKLDIGPFSLLVNGRAGTFERDADAFERGYDGDSAGIQLGLDKRLSDRTVLGGFLAFERSEADFDGDPAGLNPAASEGSTETDTWSLIVFAAHALSDTLHLEATAGYGRSDYSFQRNTYYQDSVPTTLIPVVTRGDSEGQNTWLSMGITYTLGQGALAIDPYARLTYARSEIDAYSETEITATGLAMRYADSERTSLTSVLGLHVGMTQSMSWGVLVPYFRLEYEHEFKNDPQDVQSFFVLDGANTLFAPRGSEPDRDYFNLGAGAQFVYPNGWLGFIEIEALLGHSDLERSRLLLGLRKEL